tara:strand:- start:195 stop:392 length:198 start_codon:yes stop_codon:yes gene_type:complete
MTEPTQVTISMKEYGTLLGIAITARSLTNYYRDTDTFKFMVEHNVVTLEKKLDHESVKAYVGKEY